MRRDAINLRASSVFYNVVGGSQNLDCSPGRRGGTAGINVHTPLGSVPSFVVRHSRARVASAEPRGSRARRVVTARRSRVARWRVPGLDASMVAEPPDDDHDDGLRGPRLLAALGVRVPARPRVRSRRRLLLLVRRRVPPGLLAVRGVLPPDRRAGAPADGDSASAQPRARPGGSPRDHQPVLRGGVRRVHAQARVRRGVRPPAPSAAADARPVHGPRRRGARLGVATLRARADDAAALRRRRLRRRVLRRVRVRRGRVLVSVSRTNERDSLSRARTTSRRIIGARARCGRRRWA